MGCTAANAYKRQFQSDEYGGPIHYYVFDCIRYMGKSLLDVPFIERYDEYLGYQLWDLFKYEDCIELAETYYDNFEGHLKDIFAAGGEGMVFKHKQSLYRPGARTSPLREAYKYKEHLDSLDLVCMELLDPVKEYTGKEIDSWQYWEDDIAVTKPYALGWKNAMRLGAYKNGKLIEVCRVASGLTDALREDMANNPNAYLGKVIEIECMSVNKKDGTVRHPVFLCVRFDKDAADCKWEEIFNG